MIELYNLLQLCFVLLTIILGIFVVITYYKFLIYLKAKSPEIIDLLINKESLINLPFFMNIKPLDFLRYCFKIDKKHDDRRIRKYKISYLSTLFLALVFATISYIFSFFINKP